MQTAIRITYSSKISSAVRFSDSKRVFRRISNAVCGSNIQWRGRSFSATVLSDSSKPQRGQKRISKDERRVMLESFVDKYRASNAGKFPTPSAAIKQVGGGYYVIKRILQELEYRSKISPRSKSDATLSEKVPNEVCRSPSKVRDASSSEKKVHLTSNVPSLGVKEASHAIIINIVEKDEAVNKSIEAKGGTELTTDKLLFEEPGYSTKTGDPSNSIGIHSRQIKLESKEVLHPHSEIPEGSENEKATSEGSLDINGGTGELIQATGHEAPDSDKFERDISRKEKEEDQLPRRSTVWGNLRSFADGIINLWRKM